jgi:hypothetical protein
MTKNVIWGGVVGDNSSKLLYNAIIFKDRKKNRELVFSTMARHLLEGKKGLLLLLIIRGKVCANCQEKPSIWGGPNIKRDMNV